MRHAYGISLACAVLDLALKGHFLATEGGSKYALEAEIGRVGLAALGVGARLLRKESGG